MEDETKIEEETKLEEPKVEDTVKSDETSGKTFTQDELNKIINDRLRKAAAEIEDLKEKAEKFDILENEKLTEEERLKKELEEKDILLSQKEKELQEKEYKITTQSLNVKNESLDDVILLAKSKEGDFEENVKEILTKYPHFTKVKVVEEVGIGLDGTTAPSNNGGGGKSDPISDKIEKMFKRS